MILLSSRRQLDLFAKPKPSSEAGYQQIFAERITRLLLDRGVTPPRDLWIAAHAALSSGWGRSRLARAGRNLWGVKAGRSWRGEVLELPDGLHRVYPDEEAAARDHLDLVLHAPRYHAAALALHAADPSYFRKLIAAGWGPDDPALRASAVFEHDRLVRQIGRLLGRT